MHIDSALGGTEKVNVGLPENIYEKAGEHGGKYVDKLRALLEDSFDDVLNLGGLRVITAVCKYVANDAAHDQTRTKREQ